MKATAPGKLILSGEHGVVYNRSAIALAIDKNIQTTITAASHSNAAFSLLGTQGELSLAALHALKHDTDERYRAFLNDACDIKDVIAKPQDLSLYCLADVLSLLEEQPDFGFTLSVQSSLPVGAGLGSSAAVILSTLIAASKLLEHPLEEDELLNRAIHIENLQHGRSSGLDVHTSLNGGCLSLQGDEITSKNVPAFHFFLVFTGKPESSTGECLVTVAKQYRQSSIWDEFKSVTHDVELAMDQLDFPALKSHLKRNHALLNHIGVVPERVSAFITDCEAVGAAAKICGAGSVTGDAAGMVLVATDDIESITPLCEHYHFPCAPVEMNTTGAHVV